MQNLKSIERVYNHVSAILDGLDAEETILFLDEPALGHAGFDYEQLWEPLFGSFDVVSGIHTCGNMDWDVLFNSSVEIISFGGYGESRLAIVWQTDYRLGFAHDSRK